jgi:hypothetical protein
MVVEEIRKNVESAIGRLSPKRAQELASSLMPGQSKEQIAKATQSILEWSNRNRERVTELVRAEVRSQMNQFGVASRDEVDALRRRVRELEKAQAKPRRSTAKRSSAKRSTTRKRASAASTADPAPSAAEPADAPPIVPVAISGAAPGTA